MPKAECQLPFLRRSIRDDIHEGAMQLIRSECSDCLAAPC
jgi:hypothetical protein